MDILVSLWRTLHEYVIGAAISGGVGLYFARHSSRQLRETHRQVVLLLRALEATDVIHLNRNDAGEATGVIINLSAKVVGSSHMLAEAIVERRMNDSPDRKESEPV